MDEKKRENGGGGGKTEKTKSVGEEVDEALKKCLEENKGDSSKCKSMVEAFKSPPPPPPPPTTRKPISPLRLRSGSLTDV